MNMVTFEVFTFWLRTHVSVALMTETLSKMILQSPFSAVVALLCAHGHVRWVWWTYQYYCFIGDIILIATAIQTESQQLFDTKLLSDVVMWANIPHITSVATCYIEISIFFFFIYYQTPYSMDDAMEWIDK